MEATLIEAESYMYGTRRSLSSLATMRRRHPRLVSHSAPCAYRGQRPSLHGRRPRSVETCYTFLHNLVDYPLVRLMQMVIIIYLATQRGYGRGIPCAL